MRPDQGENKPPWLIFDRKGFGDSPDTRLRLAVEEFAAGDGRTHRYVAIGVGEPGQRSTVRVTVRKGELAEAVAFLQKALRWIEAADQVHPPPQPHPSLQRPPRPAQRNPGARPRSESSRFLAADDDLPRAAGWATDRDTLDAL